MMNLVAAELYFILLNQNALIVSKGIKKKKKYCTASLFFSTFSHVCFLCY